MSKKFKYSLRNMIVVKRNDACKTITLGMIVDLFMYYIMNILPFNRFDICDDYSMDRDMKRLYNRSMKLYKKIERLFTQKLADLYVVQAFAVSYVDITDALYDSIDSVANSFYFGKDKALYTVLREFSLPPFCSGSEDYKDLCAFYGFATEELPCNFGTEDIQFDASAFIGDLLANQAD